MYREAVLIVLWPRTEWEDSPLPSRLLALYVEIDEPLHVGAIERELALVMDEAYSENERVYERMAGSFRLAAVLLNIETLAWIIDLVVQG